MPSNRPIWPWIVVFGVIALLLSPLILQMSLIPTGWNTDSNFDRVYVGDKRFDLNDRAASHPDLESGHVYSKEAIIKPYLPEWDSRTWADAQTYSGTTKIKLTLSNPTEVWLNPSTRDWEPTQNTDTPFDYYTKTVGGVSYTYEHRVFEIDVQVITEGVAIAYGGVYQGTCDGLPSAPITWYNTDDTNRAVAANQDHAAEFEVRPAFNLNPWSIYVGQTFDASDTDEEGDYYVVEDEFMGVMSASVIDVALGAAAGSPEDPTFGGRVLPTQQKGAALSLFNFDDSDAQSYYNQLESQGSAALGSISGVPLGLMMSLSGTIEPGLQVTYGLFYTWTGATPVQNFITWRIRVDVLTALGVRLVSGAQPTITPTPTIVQPPPDFPDPFQWLWDGLGAIGEWFSNPFNVMAIVVIAVVVLIVIAYILGKRIPFINPGGGRN